MRLVVHIERVVVEGVPLDPHQRDQLRTGLERELAAQIRGRHLAADLAGGAALARLPAPTVHLDPVGRRGPAGPLATQVAGSLAAALAGPGAPAGGGAR